MIKPRSRHHHGSRQSLCQSHGTQPRRGPAPGRGSAKSSDGDAGMVACGRWANRSAGTALVRDHGGCHTCQVTAGEIMPTLSSSPIDPALGHLAGLTGDAEDPPGLLAVLANVIDPRHRRGIRHRLAVILGLAVCAVLAGRARSPRSLSGPPTPMCRLWPGWGVTGGGALGVHLPAHLAAPGRGRVRRPGRPVGAAADGISTRSRRVIAVDGKTLRGSGHGGRGGRHLPAALDHAHGVVLGQADVDVKTNEVRREAPCRIPIQLGGTRKEVLGSMANTQADIVIFSPGPVCQRLPWLVCSDSLRVGPAGCARSDRWP